MRLSDPRGQVCTEKGLCSGIANFEQGKGLWCRAMLTKKVKVVDDPSVEVV